jgi:histidine ammonia-lyase
VVDYYVLADEDWDISDIQSIISNNLKLKLSKDVAQKISNNRAYLEKTISSSSAAIYGINTGFGSLCDIRISEENLEELQLNLIRSHACGMGDLVPLEVVKIIFLLKIKNLCLGFSGVRLSLIEKMIEYFNHEIYPVIYTLGSLGASGDLAPLAHLSLTLIGEGDVWFGGEKLPTAQILKKLNISPTNLESKEGLALLNGTQFCTAYGVFNLLSAFRIIDWANAISAFSLSAFDCSIKPFDPLLHKVRRQSGQINVSQRILSLLRGVKSFGETSQYVQDPYSFRCIPQVHGASLDLINFFSNTIHQEINAVTDNPTVFDQEDKILSGGNFHAQPIALGLDILALALAELANISERRIFHLISGKRDLPPFLTPNAGLNSGLMIAQYTAAGIVSQNKQLCTPASVDSIVSCNGQEDHVSMGANAATKCYQVVLNTFRVLGIELLAANQALYFKAVLFDKGGLNNLLEKTRDTIPYFDSDIILYPHLDSAFQLLKNNTFSDYEK